MSALPLPLAKTLAHRVPRRFEGYPHNQDLLETASDDGVKL